MKILICWFKTIWRTLGRIAYGNFDGIYISGHDYVEAKNGDLICVVCGSLSKTFKN